MSHTTIPTFTGKWFDLAAPDPALVDIRDIARGLSMANRFVGQTRGAYTVAQHSVKVSEWCEPKDAAYMFLHDAAEAYIGDISRPFKHMVPAIVQAEAVILAAVLTAFGIQPDEAQLRRCKCWDDLAIPTEARILFPKKMIDSWPRKLPHPIREPLYVWDRQQAERRFLKRFVQISRQFKPFADHFDRVYGDPSRITRDVALQSASGEESQVLPEGPTP